MKGVRPKEENIKCWLNSGSLAGSYEGSKLRIFVHVRLVSALSFWNRNSVDAFAVGGRQ